MDRLIEEYKKQLIYDEAHGYGYTVALKKLILKDIESYNFKIPVKFVQEMINKARIEGVV